MTALPTSDQLATLPLAAQHVVGPEHLDENGHMNISHYFVFAGKAMWNRQRREWLIDEDYIPTRGMTSFTAEQHIRYFAECVEGDAVDVRVVIVGRADKAFHMAALLVNRTKGELACVVESIAVHVDFTTRRPVPFPDDVATAMDRAIASDRRDWPLPLSGALGVRTSAN